MDRFLAQGYLKEKIAKEERDEIENFEIRVNECGLDAKNVDRKELKRLVESAQALLPNVPSSPSTSKRGHTLGGSATNSNLAKIGSILMSTLSSKPAEESKGLDLDRLIAADESEEDEEIPWIPKDWGDDKRRFIFRVLDDIDSSYISKMFSVISGGVVILSAIVLILESLPEYRYPRYGDHEDQENPTFIKIEVACVIFFTLEYIIRICTVSSMSDLYIYGNSRLKPGSWGCFSQEYMLHIRKTIDFIVQPMNIIDLVAILPFYVNLIVSSSSVNLTSIRALRLLRLAKLFKSNKMIPLLMRVGGAAAPLMSQIAMLLCLFILFMASVVFIVEQGEYNEDTGKFERDNIYGEKETSPFDSVFISMWYVMVTFTTVGYGDMIPTTLSGRLFKIDQQFIRINKSSLVLFAVPITIISSIFTEQHTLREREIVDRDLFMKRKLLREVLTIEGGGMNRIISSAATKTKREENLIPPFYPETGNSFSNVFHLFEDMESSTLSSVVQGFITIMIVISTISLTVESLPKYRYPNHGSNQGDSAPQFYVIEVICSTTFSIEIAARAISVGFVEAARMRILGYTSVGNNSSFCGKFLYWLRSPGTLIDLISVLPFFLQLSKLQTPSLAFIRILRLLRVTRIFRLVKGLSGTVILTNAIYSSLDSLFSLGFLFAVWIVVCASVIYVQEKGSYNETQGYYERETFFGERERTPFQSIPDTFWWMIVTITTVGYGDTYPTSTEGRVLGGLIVFLSIVLLAVPISIVAVNIEEAANRHLMEARITAKQSDIKSAQMMTENPSLEFHESFTKLNSATFDSIRKMEDLLKYQTILCKDDGSAALMQIHCSNLLLVSSGVADAQNQMLSLRRQWKKLMKSFEEFITSQTRVMCQLSYVGIDRKGCRRLFFLSMFRRMSSQRANFLAWSVYVRLKKRRMLLPEPRDDSEGRSAADGKASD
eukprot:jgi/Bigna1/82898/fgenesh1_pg.99_\